MNPVKLSTVFLLLAAFLLAGCSHSKKEYYPDGKLKSVIGMKGKKFEGKAVWYHESGGPMMECTYHFNMLEGKLTRYYDNGIRQEEYTYKDDILSGHYGKWDRNGKIMEQGDYAGGVQDGPCKKYFINGQIREEGQYSHGKKEGRWFYYDAFGNLLAMKLFHKGVE